MNRKGLLLLIAINAVLWFLIAINAVLWFLIVQATRWMLS